MGARTTFVQAMVMGAVVGAALTTAVFQLRGNGAPAVADRIAEREALLAKLQAPLARCSEIASPPIVLRLVLHLDTRGKVTRVDSNASELGHKAATCAETALLQGASFAAAPRPTEVPFTVVLGK